MPTSKHDRTIATGLFLAAFGFYAGFLSKAYVFEGLIRAMPIETGRWGYLFPGNYLLYGPLGLTFHTFLSFLGVHQPAITSLQILDSIIGATGIFIFYLLLRRLDGSVFASVVWSAILAFSLGYWSWSTEAEDYILSTVLLMTTFYCLVKYYQGGRVDPVAIGALHGVAILGHIVNTIFGVVVLYFFWILHGRKGLRPALRYAAAATCVTGAAYGGVLYFIQKPSTFQGAFAWFKGSAAMPHDSIRLGGGFTLNKLQTWLKMTAHILGSFSPAYTQPPAWPMTRLAIWLAWGIFGIFGLVLLIHMKEIVRKHPAVVGGCLLWLFVYACVFTRWEPWTMVYRVSDLVPICVLLFVAYREVGQGRGVWRGAAVALACLLGFGNLGAEIYPRSFASNNPGLTRMAFLKENTSEQDWITGSSGQDEIYIPYFAQRRPIVMGRYTEDPRQLSNLIRVLQAHGQKIYVTSRVLTTGSWQSFFDRYRLTKIGQDVNGFALYRVGNERI